VLARNSQDLDCRTTKEESIFDWVTIPLEQTFTAYGCFQNELPCGPYDDLEPCIRQCGDIISDHFYVDFPILLPSQAVVTAQLLTQSFSSNIESTHPPIHFPMYFEIVDSCGHQSRWIVA